jgi:serine/threonine protein kinase
MVRPEIIGEGTYGCVIKPSLKCKDDDNITYTNKVSKVMNEYDAKKELSEYKSLSKIQDIEKYAVTAPQLCKPIMDDTFLDSVKKCNTRKVRDVYNRNKSNLSMLILEDGGLNLDTYIKKIFNRSTDEEQKVFLTSLINLIDGLSFFKTKDIMHRDIKLLNIVYNVNEGKSKFIDFGLMTKMTTFIKKCNNNKEHMARSWYYYPPENSCGNKNDFILNPKCKNYSSHYSYDNFLKHLSNNFDLYCLSLAFLDLIKILSRYANKKYTPFLNAFYNIIKDFIYNYPHKRITNIQELKDKYTKLLEHYNLYLKKNISVSTKTGSLVKEVSSKEIKQNIKKNKMSPETKECKEPKPDYNHITKRCISKCKEGHYRDDNFKCIKHKTKKSIKTLNMKYKKIYRTKKLSINKVNKSINNKSIKKKANKDIPTIELEKKCKKLNKDLNPYTRRCNMKCKPNQIRDSNFKCISNKN